MKLLFDANLSPKLVPRLAEAFSGSRHVFDVDLEGATDDAILGENPWLPDRFQGQRFPPEGFP